jgi:hypothetical protein
MFAYDLNFIYYLMYFPAAADTAVDALYAV